MNRSRDMRINDAGAYRTTAEIELISELLVLKDRRLLELGCGAAHTIRLLAEGFGPRQIVATEVDCIQHQKNLAIADLPQVSFRLGGAEDIADPDEILITPTVLAQVSDIAPEVQRLEQRISGVDLVYYRVAMP